MNAGSMMRITSRSNPQFKLLKLLSSSAKERRRHGRMVLDGPHLLGAYLDHGGMPELVAVDEEALGKAEIAGLIARVERTTILSFPAPLFAQLAPVEHPVGILAVARIPEPANGVGLGPCVVLLDGVQDPGNVGTIIRTAAAAGASDVLLSAGCADPWSPRTLRAGMGAHFALTIRASAEPASALHDFTGQVIATVARGGVLPQSIDLTGAVAFVFGSEGAGLSRAWRDGKTIDVRDVTAVTIPMAPGIESLNVAAAAAVLLFERVRQRTDAPVARR